MLKIAIELIYDTFVIMFANFFEWQNREKTHFKDEGVGMEYSLIDKMAICKYVTLIKLDWISASLYF